MYDYNPYARLFEHTGGSPLDRQLHRELLDTVVTATNLVEARRDNMYVDHNVQMVYHVTALAKIQDNHAVAFSLADAGNHMLRAAQWYAQTMAGLHPTVTSGVCKGGVRYLAHNAEFAARIVNASD